MQPSGTRTESDAEGFTGRVGVVLELVVEEAEDSNEEVEEDEDDEEHLAATVVDHPHVPALAEVLGLERRLERRRGQTALQALQPTPLSLVALQVRGRVSSVEVQVGVVLHVANSAPVSKVESRCAVRHGSATKRMKGRE